jgi:hypothetical protein
MVFVLTQLRPTFPTKGAWDRLMPGDLAEFDMAKGSTTTCWRSSGTAYMVSDFSAYINGEVVVIDGGEWLKGAGQFNMLEAIPEVDQLEMMIKAKKNK